jgi:hypothetical protein
MLTMSETDTTPKRLLIRGLIPNPYFPSDALLTIELDLTDLFTEAGPDYMAFKQKLEDMLNAMDRKYAKSVNKLRGRRVSAAYKTMLTSELLPGQKKPKAVKHRGRVLQVQPYPSRFSSVLGELRTEFYGDKSYQGLLKKHNAQPLHSSQHGKRRFVTYFLHEEDAMALQRDVDELNKTVDKLNGELKEFEASSDFGDIIQYLREKVTNGRWSRTPPIHSTIHRAQLNYTPLVLGAEMIENYTDENVKEQLRHTISQMVEKIAGNFQAKLSEWMAKLTTLLAAETLNSQDVETLGTQLAEIRTNATRYQMQAIVGQHFETCEALLAAVKARNQPEVTPELAHTLLQSASDKVAETLHIQAGDPKSTLKEASLTLKKVDPVTRALIESML